MLVNIGGDLLVLCTRLATLETMQRIQGTPPPFHHQKSPQKLRKFRYEKPVESRISLLVTRLFLLVSGIAMIGLGILDVIFYAPTGGN